MLALVKSDGIKAEKLKKPEKSEKPDYLIKKHITNSVCRLQYDSS